MFTAILHTVVLCLKYGNGFFTSWAEKIKSMPLSGHDCRALQKTIFTLAVSFSYTLISSQIFPAGFWAVPNLPRLFLCCGHSWSGYGDCNLCGCFVCCHLYCHMQLETPLPGQTGSEHSHLFYKLEILTVAWIPSPGLENECICLITKTSFLASVATRIGGWAGMCSFVIHCQNLR